MTHPNQGHEEVSSCFSCPVGAASAVGRGGQCPFVDRVRRPGEYVYFHGEAAQRVWFIKRGAVVLTRSMGSTSGDESARTVRRAGAFLGAAALVHTTYLDSARVIQETTLCGASCDEMDSWLGEKGSPARTMLEQNLRTQVTEAVRAASADGNAARRVARWIISEEEEGTAPQVPRRFVAGMLGMVPETFSRALSALAKSGAISTTRRTIRIRDREALRTAAGIS